MQKQKKEVTDVIGGCIVVFEHIPRFFLLFLLLTLSMYLFLGNNYQQNLSNREAAT